MVAACSSRAAALLLLLLLLCLGQLKVKADSSGSSNSTQAYSCDAVHKVPAEQRCSFIRGSCESESLIPYAEWYYCHVVASAAVLRWMYVAAVCCLLPMAFCLLGDTAEFYIAPIMAHVSQAVPKMRPRFAGVTFVALGNGAPDLSANIAAISAGEVTLSAGALTGAAMFVQCIVAAELVALAGPRGIKCGGAMLRDVGVYCLAIASVLLAFALGQVSRAFVGWAVALYVVYMVWVFAGDEWHQRGRPTPRLDARSFKAMLSSYLPGGSNNNNNNALFAQQRASWSGGGGVGPPWGSAAGGLGSRPGSFTSGAQRVSSGLGYGTRDELEESLLPWAVAEEEPDTFYAVGGGSGMQGAAGEGQQGFAQLPQSVAERIAAALQQQQQHGSGGGASGRPSSAISAQLSTELSDFGAATLASRRGSATGDGSSSMQGGSPTYAPGTSAPVGSTFLQQQQQQLLAMRGSSSYPHPATAAPGRTSTPLLQMQHSHPPPGAVTPQTLHLNPALQPAQPHLVTMGSHSYLDPKTYRQLVWADLADDAEEEARLERDIARQLLSRRGPGSFGGTGSYQPPSAAQLFSSTPVTPLARHQQQQQQRQSAARAAGSSHGEPPEQHAAAAIAAASAAELESGLLFSPFGPEAARTAPSTPTAAADEAAAAAAELDSSLRQIPSSAAAGGAAAIWRSRQASEAGGAVGSPPNMQQQQQQQQLVHAAAGVDSWRQLQWELTLGNSAEWQEAGAVLQAFRKVTFPLLLPAYLGQRLTIPFASSDGYSRQWLIAALLCCPLALILYLGLLTMPAVLTACGCGVAAAAAAALLTAWDAEGQMPVQGLGGSAAAVVPGVLAVLAFCMGVVWIDTVATEVVGVITFLGGLAGLPAGVMGLTLLAWGNSLGDFFGNRAMAKAGHGSTAITACFAAPLFNMLMSLSLGFSSYLHKLGAAAVHVQLTPEVALGCVFLMGYNVVIIAVGRLCDNRLPPWFAVFARAWYALYFGLSLFFGFYGSGTATAAAAQS